MKAGYWVLIFVAAVVLIYGYNMGWFNNLIPSKNPPVPLYNADGTPVNPNASERAKCPPNCLEPHPSGYYTCKKNCDVFERQTVIRPTFFVRPVVYAPLQPMGGGIIG